MNTPWGKSDYKKTLARGIHVVSTPSHGGIGVSFGKALELFSEKCTNLAGQEYGGYIWFEEDCATRLALFDSKALFTLWCTQPHVTNYDELLKEVESSSRRWFPKYFEVKES